MRSATILLFFLFTLPSCHFRVPRDPGWLVINLMTDPPTLNPITTPDASATAILSRVMETLAERNPATMEWRPRLATHWELSEDHLRFTFFLRQDVHWHDGAPFTADDVVYSFERLMDPKVDAAALRVYLKDIKTVEQIDAYTVRFIFRVPYYKSFDVAADMPIVAKHVFDDGHDFNTHAANRHPIGTGPYRFKEWETGRHIILERNENYWRELPEIKGVNYRMIASNATAFQALKKGEIDIGGLEPIQWTRQTNSKNFSARFTKYRFYPPGFFYIGWNLRKSQFADRRVRQALTMLLDREKILQKILYGEGILLSGNFYPLHPSYDQSILPWPYDPAQAIRQLAEAGWTDHDGDGIIDRDGISFEFTFLYPAGVRLAESLGSIMREDFGKVGILVNPQQLEWATFLKHLDERSFDAFFSGWLADDPEDDPYQIWHSSQTENGSNYIGFQNAEADRLIEMARPEFDPVKRVEIYHRFHRIMHEEQPYTFLYVLAAHVAVHKRFTNVHPYPMGLRALEWGIGDSTPLWQ